MLQVVIMLVIVKLGAHNTYSRRIRPLNCQVTTIVNLKNQFKLCNFYKQSLKDITVAYHFLFLFYTTCHPVVGQVICSLQIM